MGSFSQLRNARVFHNAAAKRDWETFNGCIWGFPYLGKSGWSCTLPVAIIRGPIHQARVDNMGICLSFYSTFIWTMQKGALKHLKSCHTSTPKRKTYTHKQWKLRSRGLHGLSCYSQKSPTNKEWACSVWGLLLRNSLQSLARSAFAHTALVEDKGILGILGIVIVPAVPSLLLDRQGCYNLWV